MGYYDHDQPEQGTALSVTTQLMQVFVRLVGVALLLVGLWAGVKVILAAWALYQQPQRVERFATAIEQGSHLDSLLTRIRPKAATNTAEESSSTAPAAAEAAPQPPPSPVAPEESFRLSYFLAWFIAILLLMLVGRLAMAAIRTGGELALYDTQVKRFARALLEQTREPQAGAKR